MSNILRRIRRAPEYDGPGRWGLDTNPRPIARIHAIDSPKRKQKGVARRMLSFFLFIVLLSCLWAAVFIAITKWSPSW